MGFFEVFAYVLAFFYALIPNLGISIILLTITVMLLMFPLTAKQAKSMVEMQRLQPEIRRLQQKHKGDRAKLNEEMMKLYQEHKVNPLGGCLPLLVQMPVFIALFQVLRSAYKYVPEGSQLYQAFCGNETRDMCKELGPNHLEFLGMDLSVSATDVSGGFLSALPYFVLVGLVVLTGYLQSRQTMRSNPQAVGPAAMVGKVLPIVFGVFSLQFPSGLVLYFLTSNLWRLGQQELIMRKIAPRPAVAGGPPPRPEPDADAAGNGEGSRTGLLGRLLPPAQPTSPPEELPEEPAEPPSAPQASSRASSPRNRRKKRKKR
jgi:YidC/Oxa1 family membrane protein insertase